MTRTRNTKVVTSPTEARSILREYIRSGKGPYSKTETSTARRGTAAQIVEWYEGQYGITLDRGWYGRSLQHEANKGRVEYIVVDGVMTYRTR